jgi:prepilin-type processing-associated H-X9-DG protein
MNAEPWAFGGAGKQGIARGFWFCYVMNIRLNQTLLLNGGLPADSFKQLVRQSHIRAADRTVVMVEMRSNPIELPPNDPGFNRNLDRAACSWKRFSARHFRGGHLSFADGHVAWFTNDQATTNMQGSREPTTPNGDWNTNRLIWDPIGPATN